QIGLIMRGRIDGRALWRHRGFFLALGLLVGINTNMGFAAVRYIDPGTASVLSLMSIPFGIALGVAWLGERPGAMEVLGAACAFAGVLAISAQAGDYLRWGSAMIVAATFLYAAHSALAKRYGGEIPFGQFMFFRAASVAAVLVALVLVQGELVWP